MRRKLKKLAVKVGYEEADYDNVENMFRGWMGGHYKLLSREQRKNLIQLYEDLFSKEITIVNKKLIVSDRSAWLHIKKEENDGTMGSGCTYDL